jgi:hypothetical protein
MVVFTDGTDRAARHTGAEAIASVKAKADSHHVFSIGLGDEYDPGFLKEIGIDGFQPASNPADLELAFERIATHVDRVASSYYRLDYCTPARAGRHSITIAAMDRGRSGASEPAGFDATGFTYGCLVSCATGLANCDNDPLTGCETALDGSANCGGCGTRCGPMQAGPTAGQRPVTTDTHCPDPRPTKAILSPLVEPGEINGARRAPRCEPPAANTPRPDRARVRGARPVAQREPRIQCAGAHRCHRACRSH